ncbi:hypothetical protein OH779_20395 [Actinacidiphila glaucinigra]|uniref:hypothetical protein n=1 Tax=Actinacidiphila glaucinigra TaxID=235986 RepID=UPI00386604B9
MSTVERTPGQNEQHDCPATASVEVGRSALAWAQIGFSTLCVAAGAVIGLTGNAPLGMAIVTASAGWQITVHIRR